MATDTVQTTHDQTTAAREEAIQAPAGKTETVHAKTYTRFPGGCSLERVQEGWLFGDRHSSVVIPLEIAGDVARAILADSLGESGNTS